ncbi:RHS repeat-associated core domain-containing protein [Streptomyces eurythermus]|uniref:RHS repeat-associated core domain-containing protein n=1 Tax=Streptomyces eurythermus TaxID=42237 RepID=UPI0037A5671D
MAVPVRPAGPAHRQAAPRRERGRRTGTGGLRLGRHLDVRADDQLGGLGRLGDPDVAPQRGRSGRAERAPDPGQGLAGRGGRPLLRDRVRSLGRSVRADRRVRRHRLARPGHQLGLHYNYLRYYDPEIGHYISLDPLGLAPAANPVGYVDRPSASCDPRASLPRSHRSRPSRTRHPIFPTWHRISTRKEG